MKATELRIGNLLYDKDGYCQIILADFYNIYLDDNLPFEPIPLTKEWLIKLGFEKVNGWDDMFFYKKIDFIKQSFELEKNDKGFEYNDFLIKYVNQLQNLFFALTGEELEIKQG